MPQRLHPQDWEKRRRALFEAVIELPESERAAYIQRETSGDAALRDSVLRLLHATRGDHGGILDRPVYQRREQSHAADAPPLRIGNYEVVRHLGSGGMANVYACRAANGQLVAVKLLRTGLDDADFLERFRQEREIQSRIEHPNVCRLLDGGSTDHGAPFIVTELVDGQRIDRHCSSLGLSVRERLGLFSQVLAGVEYFHRRQIVHRDLKPTNIFATSAGRAKILDFGIAKIVAHRAGMTGHGPTRSVLRLMTPPYASPEQLQGRLSGRASDIYSLGVVLYELITGRHPFSEVYARGGTERLLAAMNKGLPAPPSTLVPVTAVSGSIDDIVLKALQFDPGQRYASVGQFLECLGPFLEARPPRSPARSV
ncbi:MAG: serine/threonine protein kinase [Acidobacteriia bacterium]|nr:serine/threonine protein kinase [Terriglobia bacterium]